MNVFPFPYPDIIVQNRDEERKSALAIAYSGDGYAFHLVDYLGSWLLRPIVHMKS